MSELTVSQQDGAEFMCSEFAQSIARPIIWCSLAMLGVLVAEPNYFGSKPEHVWYTFSEPGAARQRKKLPELSQLASFPHR